MQFRDKASEYNSFKLKLNRNLKEVSKIGVDISIYRNTMNSIDNEVRNCVNNIVSEFDDKNVFREDQLRNIYDNGLKKLQTLKDEIGKDYSVYYKIYYINKRLSEFLSYFVESELDEFINEAINLLELMDKSSTKDYKTEEQLFSVAYSNVYQMLLYESLYSNDTKLLEYIKKNDTHSNYINVRLSDEMDNIDDKESVNLIVSKEISKNSLDYSLLDKNIISFIASKDKTILKIDGNDIHSYSNKIECELKENDIKGHDSTRNIASFEINIEEAKTKLKKYYLARAMTVMIAIGILAGNIAIVKNGHKEYKIYTIEKDIDSAEERTIYADEYKSYDKINTSRYVKERLSWENIDGSDGYTQDTAIYRVNDSSIGYSEYRKGTDEYEKEITMEKKSNMPLVYEGTTKEYKENLTEEDLYWANKIVISKAYIDKDDYIKAPGLTFDMIIALGFGDFILIIILGAFLSVLPKVEEERENGKTYPICLHNFIYYLELLFKNKKNIKLEKKVLLECKERLNTLLNEVKLKEKALEDSYIYSAEDKEEIKRLVKTIEDKISHEE